jgi:hypothetical protein
VEAEGREAVIHGASAARAPRATPVPAPALSVVVVLPPGLVPQVGYAASLKAALATLDCTSEVLVLADGRDLDAALQAWPGAEVDVAPVGGYGAALVHGLRRARGEWVLAVDADLREPGPALVRLWGTRDRGEILIAAG